MNWYLEVLKKYAVFEGRARRKEYWMFFLFNMIFSYVAILIGHALGMSDILYNIYVLAVLIPGIAAGVRRMHDVGKSGWWLLFPVVNLVLACQDSQLGDNAYGSNPKMVNSES